MASNQIAHADVLDALYEAALQPDLLPDALHAYATELNAAMASVLELSEHRSRVVISPAGREGAEAYAKGWWKLDLPTQRGHERRVRGIVTDLDLTTAEERARHPFYQEFSQEFDCFWICANVIERPGAPPLAFSVRRAESCGAFRSEELQKAALFTRHAARAFDFAAKLADASNRSAALTEALTHLGHGVIGLDATGKVRFTNAIIEQLCGDGLHIANGAVSASTSSGQRALDQLIAETLALAERTSTAPPRPVALQRPSGRSPAIVYGIPVPERHGDVLALLGGRPNALIVVIEPDAARQLDEELLREMFTLSPGEARLAAAIATGATPKQAAKRFGLTEGTVRVVLKAVFQKVGVSRQSELVLQLAPLLRR